MVVASVSAECARLDPKKYPQGITKNCYTFSSLNDLLSIDFGMGDFHKPDDTLAGLTAWLVGNRYNEVSAKEDLGKHKNRIEGLYNQYQKVSAE